MADIRKLSDEELNNLLKQAKSTPKIQDLSDEELSKQLELLRPKEPETLDPIKTFATTGAGESVDQLKAGALGVAQGATLGFADEIAAAVGATKGALQGKGIKQAYLDSLENVRSTFKEAEEQQPGAFLAGDVAGSVGTAFVPGLNIAKGVKSLSSAGKIGKAALKGAGIGAAEGLGRTEEDVLSAGALKDVGLGAALGTVGGLVGGALGAAAKPDLTTDGAITLIAGKKAPKFFKGGKSKLAESIKSVNKLDEFKGSLLHRSSLDKVTPDMILDTAENAIQTRSNLVGNLIEAADDGSTFKLSNVLKGIKSKDMNKYLDSLKLADESLSGDLATGKFKVLTKKIGKAISREEDFTLRELQDLKLDIDRNIGSSAFNSVMDSDAKKTSLLVRKAIKEKIEDLVGPDIKKANKELSDLFQVRELFEDGATEFLATQADISAKGKGAIPQLLDTGVRGVTGTILGGVGEGLQKAADVGAGVTGALPQVLSGPVKTHLDPSVPEDRITIKDNIKKKQLQGIYNSVEAAKKMEKLGQGLGADDEDSRLSVPEEPASPNLDLIDGLLDRGE
jgi:hypothetical protein